MALTGGALRAAEEDLTPEAMEAQIDLSITDEWPLAQAFVIISAVSGGKRLTRHRIGGPSSEPPRFADLKFLPRQSIS